MPYRAALATLACLSPLAAQSPLFLPLAGPPGTGALRHVAAEQGLRPHVTGATFVTLDRALLDRFVAHGVRAGRMAVTLGGTSHPLVLDSVTPMWRHRVFRGHVAEQGHFVLAIDADGVAAAAIELADSVWSLEHTGDGPVHVLYALDHGRMAPHMRCGVDHTHHVHVEPEPLPSGGGVGVDNDRTIIDVAVFYTPAARNGAGGAAALEAQIALRVATASDAAVNSDVEHELRLVHAAETNYVETGTSTDLSRFRSTNDGYMDDVHAARAMYGADLMALIIDRSSAFCGVGYLMTNLSTGFRGSAFCVTVRGCLTGHTLTHELGHNMGSHHDRDNAGRALYSYSYGYRTPGDRYRTIMSYAPGSRVNYWSTPNKSHQGFALGTATEDNARSLNNARTTIRNFWPTRSYEWVRHAGGVAGEWGLPQIRGRGTTTGAEAPAVELSLAKLGAPGALAVGFGRQNLPLLGGTLVPFVATAIPISGSIGPFVYDASALSGLPASAEVVFQAWYLDAAGPQGVSATDALSVVRP